MIPSNVVSEPPETPPHQSYHSALEVWSPQTAGQSGAPSAPSMLSDSAWQSLWFLFDTIIWSTCAALCFSVYRWFNVDIFVPNPGILIITFAVSLFSGWLVGAYNRDTLFLSLPFTAEMLIAGAAATILGPGLVALFGNYGGAFQTSRLFLFIIPGLFTITSIVTRRLLWRAMGGSESGRRVIVIGSNEEKSALESALSLTKNVVSVVRVSVAEAINGNLSAMLGSPTKTTPTESTHSLDAVVIAPSASLEEMSAINPFLVSLHASSVPVYSWSAFWSQRIRMHDCSRDSIGGLFDRDFQLVQSSAYWHLKRAVDILIAGLGLVVSLPILLITPIIVRIDSPGPAIFKQTRIGFRGREFTIYKFRTMRQGTEADQTTTSKSDQRLTKVGAFLRQTRIDEIPQLWNVMKGDMSIVGPRPEWVVCVRDYETVLAGYHLRHLVKPGITGWAQVNYPYGENAEDALKKLAFDIYYVSFASLVLDCSIILKTLFVLLGRIGGR